MKLSKLAVLLQRNLESQPDLKDLETSGLEVIRQGGTEYVGIKCRVVENTPDPEGALYQKPQFSSAFGTTASFVPKVQKVGSSFNS